MTTRPPFIRHYGEIQEPQSEEGFEHRRAIRQGVRPDAHRHPPRIAATRQRTSLPHAESAEEEFVYVIEGTPDVWIDGELFRLAPGDGVGFPAGTGIAHSFLNNTDDPVRLIVVGETPKAENRIIYPVNPERRPHRTDWWDDAPKRPLGPHDGVPRRPDR